MAIVALPMTARELMVRLRAHHGIPSDSWAGGVLLEEVGLNGPGQQRRADAIYAGFTSASGRLLVGYEIKVSRSDWRAELAKVGKADFWHDNCHQWYIVAPSEDIVPREELPEGWGLKVSHKPGGLKIVVRAVTRDVTPSWQAMRSLLSRFDTQRVSLISDATSKLRDKHRAELDALRIQYSSDGGPKASEQVMRLQRILRRVTEHPAVAWHSIDDDDVVAALVDLTAARVLARQVVRAVQLRAQQFNAALYPIEVAGKDRIAELLAEVEKELG